VQVNEDVVDPTTGITYLQTSVDISKDQVEEQFGEDDYQCECHAWNNVPNLKPLMTRSRSAVLHVACQYSIIIIVQILRLISLDGLGHVRYQTCSVPNYFGTKKDVFGTT